jgi:competence protein ComEC
VIQTRNEVVLYDAGIAWRGGGSVAEQVLVPFLRSRKISRIDRFVVSHDDLDHSGGVKTIQAGHEIGQLLSGEPLQGIDSFACEDGLGWRADEVRFDALQVPFEVAPSGNDRSCLLRVTAGDYTLLLTGDIEAAAERWLVQHRRGLAADIALVPHHGSNTSSTSPFIDSVRPDYAVVSAGHANRWGFPKPEVVGRWRRAGAVVMNTAASGAVYFRTCARAGVVRHRLERQYRQRFWHATN